MNRFLTLTSNFERIGDHSLNIAEHARQCAIHNLSFSKEGIEELNLIRSTILEMFQLANKKGLSKNEKKEKVYILEAQVDSYTDQFRQSHIKRVQEGKCNIESGILFDEILTDLERIADHLMNIAEA